MANDVDVRRLFSKLQLTNVDEEDEKLLERIRSFTVDPSKDPSAVAELLSQLEISSADPGAVAKLLSRMKGVRLDGGDTVPGPVFPGQQETQRAAGSSRSAPPDAASNDAARQNNTARPGTSRSGSEMTAETAAGAAFDSHPHVTAAEPPRLPVASFSSALTALGHSGEDLALLLGLSRMMLVYPGGVPRREFVSWYAGHWDASADMAQTTKAKILSSWAAVVTAAMHERLSSANGPLPPPPQQHQQQQQRQSQCQQDKQQRQQEQEQKEQQQQQEQQRRSSWEKQWSNSEKQQSTAGSPLPFLGRTARYGTVKEWWELEDDVGWQREQQQQQRQQEGSWSNDDPMALASPPSASSRNSRPGKRSVTDVGGALPSQHGTAAANGAVPQQQQQQQPPTQLRGTGTPPQGWPWAAKASGVFQSAGSRPASGAAKGSATPPAPAFGAARPMGSGGASPVAGAGEGSFSAAADTAAAATAVTAAAEAAAAGRARGVFGLALPRPFASVGGAAPGGVSGAGTVAWNSGSSGSGGSVARPARVAAQPGPILGARGGSTASSGGTGATDTTKHDLFARQPRAGARFAAPGSEPGEAAPGDSGSCSGCGNGFQNGFTAARNGSAAEPVFVFGAGAAQPGRRIMRAKVGPPASGAAGCKGAGAGGGGGRGDAHGSGGGNGSRDGSNNGGGHSGGSGHFAGSGNSGGSGSSNNGGSPAEANGSATSWPKPRYVFSAGTAASAVAAPKPNLRFVFAAGASTSPGGKSTSSAAGRADATSTAAGTAGSTSTAAGKAGSTSTAAGRAGGSNTCERNDSRAFKAAAGPCAACGAETIGGDDYCPECLQLDWEASWAAGPEEGVAVAAPTTAVAASAAAAPPATAAPAAAAAVPADSVPPATAVPVVPMAFSLGRGDSEVKSAAPPLHKRGISPSAGRGGARQRKPPAGSVQAPPRPAAAAAVSADAPVPGIPASGFQSPLPPPPAAGAAAAAGSYAAAGRRGEAAAAGTAAAPGASVQTPEPPEPSFEFEMEYEPHAVYSDSREFSSNFEQYHSPTQAARAAAAGSYVTAAPRYATAARRGKAAAAAAAPAAAAAHGARAQPPDAPTPSSFVFGTPEPAVRQKGSGAAQQNGFAAPGSGASTAAFVTLPAAVPGAGNAAVPAAGSAAGFGPFAATRSAPSSAASSVASSQFFTPTGGSAAAGGAGGRGGGGGGGGDGRISPPLAQSPFAFGGGQAPPAAALPAGAPPPVPPVGVPPATDGGVGKALPGGNRGSRGSTSRGKGRSNAPPPTREESSASAGAASPLFVFGQADPPPPPQAQAQVQPPQQQPPQRQQQQQEQRGVRGFVFGQANPPPLPPPPPPQQQQQQQQQQQPKGVPVFVFGQTAQAGPPQQQQQQQRQGTTSFAFGQRQAAPSFVFGQLPQSQVPQQKTPPFVFGRQQQQQPQQQQQQPTQQATPLFSFGQQQQQRQEQQQQQPPAATWATAVRNLGESMAFGAKTSGAAAPAPDSANGAATVAAPAAPAVAAAADDAAAAMCAKWQEEVERGRAGAAVREAEKRRDAEKRSIAERLCAELKISQEKAKDAYRNSEYPLAKEQYTLSMELAASLEGLIHGSATPDFARWVTSRVAAEGWSDVAAEKRTFQLNRAASSMMLGYYEAAVKDCESILRQSFTDQRARLRLGRALLKAGRVDEATAEFETVLPRDGSGDDYTVQRTVGLQECRKVADKVCAARAAMGPGGLIERVLTYTAVALELSPNFEAAQVARLQALLDLRRPVEGASFAAACAVAKDLCRKGRSAALARHWAAPRPERAEPAQVRGHPDPVLVVNALSPAMTQLYYRACRGYAATAGPSGDVVTKVLQVAADRGDSWAVRLRGKVEAAKRHKSAADAEYAAGKFRRASDGYSRALGDGALEEEDEELAATLHLNRAAARMALRQFTAAAHDCAKALDLRPSYHKAHLRHARAYRGLENWTTAARHYEKYLAAVAREGGGGAAEGEARSELAECRLQQQRKAQARAAAAAAERRRQQEEEAARRRRRSERDQYYYNFGYESDGSDGEYGGASGGGGGSSTVVSHYTTLGIAHGATTTEVKQAYRKLALQLHPDKNPAADAHQRFQAVSAAYEVLQDASERRKYDLELRCGRWG